MKIVTGPEHGADIIAEDKAAQNLQLFFDNLVQRLNDNLLGLQVQLPIYTVTSLPVATTAAGMIYVSNETGGAQPAFSDGTNWRRFTDRAVVS